MTMFDVYELYDYWKDAPPEHEIGAMFLRAYTIWKKADVLSDPVAHRKSLEERWKAGYMNIKQMFESSGASGIGPMPKGDVPPGVGPFPGTQAQAAAP